MADLRFIHGEVVRWASLAQLAGDPPLPAALRNRPAEQLAAIDQVSQVRSLSRSHDAHPKTSSPAAVSMLNLPMALRTSKPSRGSPLLVTAARTLLMVCVPMRR
jgi:hypothetical protein